MKGNRSNFLNVFALSIFLFNFVIHSDAQVPSDLMTNCNQWKITYPTGNEDKTLCNEPNNEFFYVSDNGDAIVFKTPIRSDNGTTPNSSYIRSELRERTENGNSDIYWTTEGLHMVYVKQAITHLPINKSHLVATQIHGNKDDGIDDAMVLRLEGTHLFLSFNGGKLREDLTIKTNYTLGTIHEVIFLVENGIHYCYYSEDGNLKTAFDKDSASSYLIKDGTKDYVMDLNYDETYFKIGNYTQSNSDKEGDDTNDTSNYGEVYVYDFSVNHEVGSVSGVFLSPRTLDLAIDGTHQLSSIISPANTANKDVSYSSNNPSVATVSATGRVTGISEGVATIMVTTEEGNYTSSSIITVVPDAIGPNLALNKPVTGTGTHDGENEVTNLVDGSTTSRWSVSGFPQTATIDLGKVYNINRTEMICYTDRQYQYTVSVSNTEDGTYNEISDRSDNTSPGTSANPIVDLISNVEGRYIKIEVSGAATYTGSWVSLTEFRVYGSVTSSIIDSEIEDNLALWPNPTSSIVNVSGINNFRKLQVYNSLGRLVLDQEIEEQSINISELTSGIYIFRFSEGNRFIHKRVIKR